MASKIDTLNRDLRARIKAGQANLWSHGDGLCFALAKNGRADWVFRYTFGGKRRVMTLQSFRDAISDKEHKALELRAIELRDLVKSGVDPLAQRQISGNAPTNSGETFRDVAEAYISTQRTGWKNEKHADQWESTLKEHVYPHIGSKRPPEIGIDDVLRVLQQPHRKRNNGKAAPLWEAVPETASRVRMRIEKIISAAKSKGVGSADRDIRALWAGHTNPAIWKDGLEHWLAKDKAASSHFAALPYREVPKVVAELLPKFDFSSRALALMRYAISPHYFYQPKAKQLNDSGSKFNSWMEGRLFFLVDEIKTDEKRDMVEALKPFITEDELEIEGKNANQRMGDTPGNWLFFSNHKDAIPIHRNGRRFAIFYSAIQTVDDLAARGMNDRYFKNLYNWLGDTQNGNHQFGLKIAADWLLNYPIERGTLDARAPSTSSHNEALVESRGWLEQTIMEAAENQQPGFRCGWISTAALARLLAGQRKAVAAKTLGKALSDLGYARIGQAGRGYFQDDPASPTKRAWLWNLSPSANIADYGRHQGYE